MSLCYQCSNFVHLMVIIWMCEAYIPLIFGNRPPDKRAKKQLAWNRPEDRVNITVSLEQAPRRTGKNIVDLEPAGSSK